MVQPLAVGATKGEWIYVLDSKRSPFSPFDATGTLHDESERSMMSATALPRGCCGASRGNLFVSDGSAAIH